MKKLLLLILSMMLLTSLAFSQENYQTGYVITSNNDTIHGFINYRNWGINPDRISFKKTPNQRKTLYNPMTIRAFFVQGDYYISAIVNNAIPSGSADGGISHDPTVETKTDTAFLRVLAWGSKSLLYFKSDMNMDNFYILVDGKPDLLLHKKYIGSDNGNSYDNASYFKENKKYVGQLTIYLSDCEKITSQLAGTQYIKHSLLKLFQNYYKCKHEANVRVEKSEPAKVRFGVFANITSTKLNFTGISDSPSLSSVNFKKPVNVNGGVIIDLIMPRNLREWSLHNEIEYVSFKSTANVVNAPVGGYYTNFNLDFGYSAIVINDLLRFTYSFGTISVFANAGISNGFILKYTNHNESIHGSPSSSTPAVLEGDLITPSHLVKSDMGPVVGLGMNYKNVSLEVRYEKRSNLINLALGSALSSEIQRFSFLIGYTF